VKGFPSNDWWLVNVSQSRENNCSAAYFRIFGIRNVVGGIYEKKCKQIHQVVIIWRLLLIIAPSPPFVLFSSVAQP